MSLERLSCRAVMFAVLTMAVGCGGESEPVYPVRGKVLFQGKPIEGASVVFLSTAARKPKVGEPTPQATTNASGEYSLTSYKEGDGALPGDYGVAISWMEVTGPSDNPEREVRRDRLGGRYADPAKSGLTATVQEDATEVPPFDLK